MLKMPGPMFTPGKMPESDTIINSIVEPQSGLVKTWSYSTLKKFEQCGYAVYLSKVMKLPSTQGAAAKRGEEIHTKGELYIKGETGDFPVEYEGYKYQLEDLRAQYGEGAVHVEDEWGFTTKYDRVSWGDPAIWLRMKLDAFAFVSDTCAKIVDFKTGRKDGNEMAHGQQLQLYAIAAFSSFPQLEYIHASDWYLDQKSQGPLVHEYTRNEALGFRARWTTRAVTLTTATRFDPKPSAGACRWCDYAKSGDCEWRYTK
jgi:hypothetical protein